MFCEAHKDFALSCFVDSMRLSSFRHTHKDAHKLTHKHTNIQLCTYRYIDIDIMDVHLYSCIHVHVYK